MGRFRQFRDNGCLDSSGDQNAWSVINIPLSSTQCGQMYSDCAADLFCNTPHRSYFDYPTVTPPTCASASSPSCVRGDVLYTSPADMCAAIFSGAANATAGYLPAFISASGAGAAYVFPNKGDAPFSSTNPNPNDGVDTSRGSANATWPTTPTYPPLCPWRPKFNTITQCVNDIYYYFGMRDAARLYANPSLPASAPVGGSASSAGVYFVTNAPAACSAAGRAAFMALAVLAPLVAALVA